MWTVQPIDWKGFCFCDDFALDFETKSFLELLLISRDLLVPSPAVDRVLRRMMDGGGISHVEELMGIRIGRRDDLDSEMIQQVRSKTELRKKAFRIYFGPDQPTDPLAYILSGGIKAHK